MLFIVENFTFALRSTKRCTFSDKSDMFCYQWSRIHGKYSGDETYCDDDDDDDDVSDVW